jgi:hypothetical protein
MAKEFWSVCPAGNFFSQAFARELADMQIVVIRVLANRVIFR